MAAFCVDEWAFCADERAFCVDEWAFCVDECVLCVCFVCALCVLCVLSVLWYVCVPRHLGSVGVRWRYAGAVVILRRSHHKRGVTLAEWLCHCVLCGGRRE